jgi:hypothetical protein
MPAIAPPLIGEFVSGVGVAAGADVEVLDPKRFANSLDEYPFCGPVMEAEPLPLNQLADYF